MLRILSVLLISSAAAFAADFTTDVQPLLEAKCLGCHGPAQQLGGLSVATREAIVEAGALKPKRPKKSTLYTSLLSSAKVRMPLGAPLADSEIAAIGDWIDEGADWPAGLALGAKQEAPAEGGDAGRQLSHALHARITAQSANDPVEPYETTIPGTSARFTMTPVPAGQFTMGSPASEPGRADDEGPQHEVSVDALWIGTHEVTWDVYRLFMFSEMAKESENPDELVDGISRPTRPYVEMSFGMGIDGYPAISMTQHAARKFTQWLSAKTGHFYRLPTEAEWEYACRAGTTTAYSFGDDPAQVGDYAVFWDNADYQYAKVGTKKPNPWGLYDMHGNVMEWVLDGYEERAYGSGEPRTNPLAKPTDLYPRTVRGGSWNDDPEKLRCAARVASDSEWKMQDPQLPKSIWYHTDAQGLGLRIVRPQKIPTAEEMHVYWNNGRP